MWSSLPSCPCPFLVHFFLSFLPTLSSLMVLGKDSSQSFIFPLLLRVCVMCVCVAFSLLSFFRCRLLLLFFIPFALLTFVTLAFVTLIALLVRRR